MSAPSWLTARPIAHRGLHDAASGIVENTLSAAEAAATHGFAIECDVQDTADGEAVVFHDDDLDRLTAEKGSVRERRTAELTAIRIGTTQDRIPTFATFLDRVAGRVPLVVEIKSRFDGNMRLAERTCAQLAEYRGPVVVESFDPAVIAHVRAIAPEVVRGIVGESRYEHPSWNKLSAQTKFDLANLLHFDATAPQFLSWRVQDVPCASTLLCRRLGGIPVTAWTVRTPEERARAAAFADQMVFEGFRPE